MKKQSSAELKSPFGVRAGAVAAVLLPIFVAAVAIGSGFELHRSTVDCGGNVASTGGTYALAGTIAQHDAGEMAGGAFTLTGGFWFQQAPADCDFDGQINLQDYGDFVGCLLGPAGGLVDASCSCFDLDFDGDVDLQDAGSFQRLFDH